MTSTRQTYVFDLDGTLCETEGQDYTGARPLPRRIAIVNALYDAGHEIVIDSARGSVTTLAWQRQTEQQLDKWGVKRHRTRVGKKVYGDHYVDDKAINAEEFFK
jgi:CMP-N,N'-diacetyllegionaminic acid synthase